MQGGSYLEDRTVEEGGGRIEVMRKMGEVEEKKVMYVLFRPLKETKSLFFKLENPFFRQIRINQHN